MYLKKPGLWSSIYELGRQVDALSVEADASVEDINPRTDFYGISCDDASGESFLFGMSPDGYYTLAFDPGGDQKLEFRRLAEDAAPQPFSTTHAINRLRADCVREGSAMKLRFFVNGTELTETQHEASGELEGVELFAYSEKGGTDVRFDNVVVRSVTE